MDVSLCRFPAVSHRPVGIVDIGSNSIRLVVYDANGRVPAPMFNEKAVCGLGTGLAVTGLLHPQGVEAALSVIGRFVRLARAMGVESLDILATSAVRDAKDGPDFVDRVQNRYGVEVTVLSGGEEARLAALGVLCGTPQAHGLVADIGGGSLELAVIDHGKIGAVATLPLGVLRLADIGGGDLGKAQQHIDDYLDGIAWLDDLSNGSFYAVGGAWRALARLSIAQTNHPLLVLDSFALDPEHAVTLARLISRQSPKSLEKSPGVAKKRAATLPLAALVLERLLMRVHPDTVVFSIFGMREGRFFQTLPADLQAADPLICECLRLCAQSGRFAEHAGELMTWMDPLFPAESSMEERLRLAASILGDIFWNEHPDYRAEQAFLKILRLPFLGLDHQSRAALALAVHTRYKGEDETELTASIRSLLDKDRQSHARLTGLALRLAHVLSGGAPDILKMSRLSIEDGVLHLVMPQQDDAFIPAIVERPLSKLARALGLETVILTCG